MRPRRRAPSSAILAACGLALVSGAAACGPLEDPPGRAVDRAPATKSLAPPTAATVAVHATGEGTDASRGKEGSEPGHGAKIASIAMRTWIYVAPDDRSTKLGYLRAGAVVDRAELAAGTDGCAGGWYRIVPRGYVCVGKGATLTLGHQVVAAALRGPDRGKPLPYRYAVSGTPPPPLYYRLPSRADQERVEGPTLNVHLARVGTSGFQGPFDDPPKYLLEGRDLPKPYGAEEKLHYAVHAGHAREASAFGLITAFEANGRLFGLTTELDLIPLDRTKPIHPSVFHGVVVTAPGVPAIVIHQGATRYRADSLGHLQPGGTVDFRSGWVLTGRNNGSARGILETTDGTWLAADDLLFAEPHDDPAGAAAEGRKWIDISIRKQLLVAYEGRRPVFATLISSGLGGMGDPESTHATVRGVFAIHSKHVSATMDGDEASNESYDLRDVPYVQYFFEGYALHGAFWHDDFRKPRSHGCINLAPADAAWLFDWTEPNVPAEWHGAVNGEGGTTVWVHG